MTEEDDQLDFDGVVSGDSDTSKYSSNSPTGTSDEGSPGVFMKGDFGTTLVQEGEPCHVCEGPSDRLVVVGVGEGGPTNDFDGYFHVCENHAGEVVGDHEAPMDEIEVVKL